MKRKILKKLISFITITAVFLGSQVQPWDLRVFAANQSGECGASGSNVNFSFNEADGVLSVTGSGAMKDYRYTSGITGTAWNGGGWKNNIKQIDIGAGVTHVGDYAFYACNNLTDVSLPEDLTSIGRNAFANCNKLKAIYIPDSVDTIGDRAFTNTPAIVYYNSASGKNFTSEGDPNAAVKYTVQNGETSLEITQLKSNTIYSNRHFPETVGGGKVVSCNYADYPDADITHDGACLPDKNNGNKCAICGKISGSCGQNCTYSFDEKTKTLTISGTGTIDSFGNIKPLWCELGVEKIVIESGITGIGQGAFQITSLKSVEFKEPSSVTKIDDYAFNGCSKLNSITLPEGIKTIGNGVFTRCESLTGINIPSTVETIGQQAFLQCTELKSVNIGEDSQLKKIDAQAFLNCKSLTHIVIPAYTDTIGAGAFKKCQSLTDIIVPSTVKTIGTSAFDECVLYYSKDFSGRKINASDYLMTAVVEYTVENGKTTLNIIGVNSCTEIHFPAEKDGAPIVSSNYADYPNVKITHDGDCLPDENNGGKCAICGKEPHTHTYGSWSIVTAPTLTSTGTAERACSCGEKETKSDVPALNDGSVWTKDQSRHVEPTEEADGRDVYTSTYGEVTVILPKKTHTHAYGSWSIVTAPTLTSTGTAERACSCGDKETKNDVPALNDSSVWTKDQSKHVEPTEETDGKDVYKSEYGEVTVILPSLAHKHTFGDWTITAAPTLTSAGTAKRACGCGEKETKNDVPALSDGTVWTKDQGRHVEPTEETEGRDVYTSIYGEVAVTLPKKTPADTTPSEVPDETAPSVVITPVPSPSQTRPDETLPTEVIDNGSVVKEVKTDSDSIKAELSQPSSELMKAVFTSEELERITESDNIKIVLDIRDGKDIVSSNDMAAAQTAAESSGCKLAQYLDITLFKVMNGAEEKITKTSGEITVTLTIPENLRENGASYFLIRVHEGETDVLPDLDSNPDTITVKTDRFSAYALAYKEDDPDKNKNTGVDSHIGLFITLGVAAAYIFIVMYFTTGSYGMTEERKDRTVKAIIEWGRKSKLRRIPALAAILAVLVYYYTVGQKPQFSPETRKI